jgi:hypothetical protein
MRALFVATDRCPPRFADLRLTTLSKILGVSTVADAIWIAADHRSWARFWQRFLGRVERTPPLAWGLALTELAIGGYFLTRPPESRQSMARWAAPPLIMH